MIQKATSVKENPKVRSKDRDPKFKTPENKLPQKQTDLKGEKTKDRDPTFKIQKCTPNNKNQIQYSDPKIDIRNLSIQNKHTTQSNIQEKPGKTNIHRLRS